MTYVTCPNCGVSLTSALSAEPPSACPDCCARLELDAALTGVPTRTPRAAASSLDAVVLTGRDAPGAARRALRTFCAGLGPDVSATGALLISEVVTNAVLHGSANGASTIALHFATAGDMLQVEVSDDGPGFDPGLREATPDADSGRGLHILEALAESWGVDDGQPTRVWFELPIDAGTVPVAT